MNLDQIIVALDDTQVSKNYVHMDLLAGTISRVKIGSILFSAEGPKMIEYANQKGFKVFLDLKYHDIPNTVAKSVKAVCANLELEFITIHALGGGEMMQTVRATVDQIDAARRPKILSVTMLTSHDQATLEEIGLAKSSMSECVSRLGKLAKNSGSDGIVCSPHEVTTMRDLLGDDFVYMVPGIRLPGDDVQDQKRVATPEQALSDGASYVVMGRSITRAADPLSLVKKLGNI